MLKDMLKTDQRLLGKRTSFQLPFKISFASKTVLKLNHTLPSEVLQLVSPGGPRAAPAPASALVYNPLGSVSGECGFALWALCLPPISCDVCSLLFWYPHPSHSWIVGIQVYRTILPLIKNTVLVPS